MFCRAVKIRVSLQDRLDALIVTTCTKPMWWFAACRSLLERVSKNTRLNSLERVAWLVEI